MNNERYNQIINEVWKKYGKSHWTPPENPDSKLLSHQLWSVKPMQHNKESFINKIKTDDEFAEMWGLKIEERELSEDERYDLCAAHKSKMTAISEEDYIKYNIPTKLITVTYNSETIKVYE